MKPSGKNAAGHAWVKHSFYRNSFAENHYTSLLGPAALEGHKHQKISTLYFYKKVFYKKMIKRFPFFGKEKD